MTDQLMLLAEGASQHAEGLPPYMVGIGTFIIFMCLLGITTLTSGLNQPKRRTKAHLPADR